MRMAQKIAIITGGASGIGRACVLAFAREGAAVVVADMDATAAAAVCRDVAEAGGKSQAVTTDITDPAQVQAMVTSTVEHFGQIDVLVNNVGWDRWMPFMDTDQAFRNRVLDINLKGPTLCCQTVLPHMIARGSGRIFNVASDAGRVGSMGEVAYSSAKGGLIAFTKALAREMARHGILVNCVAPGATDTPLLQVMANGNPKAVQSVTRMIPLRRLGKPEEVAAAILFMASDEASYITGQTLSVNGGLNML